MEKYKKIYEDFYYAIKSGKYASGDLLPTEAEICERYGVSRITAKHALNLLQEKGLVRRKRRMGTAVELKDFAKRQPRGFIAVVFTHFQNCGNRIYHGLRELAERHKVNLSFFDSEGSAAKEREILSFLLTQNILGLIHMPLGRAANIDLVSQFVLHKIPTAFMDFAPTGIRAPLVTSDNFGGAYALTKYLTGLGHTDIAYYPYTEALLPTEEERFRGYCAALLDGGIAVREELFLAAKGASIARRIAPVLADGEAEAEGAAEAILSMNRRPTAVFCVNDVSASMLAAAAERRGLRVPEKLSVTGFDNLSLSVYENITTAGQNFGEIARGALIAVLRQLEKGVSNEEYVVRVPTVLTERKSTAAPCEG